MLLTISCAFLLVVAIGALSYAAALDTVASHPSQQERTSENVTCEAEDPNFIRICHDVPTLNFNCFIWNCSICFWGNDSCMNFDVGPREDCPTAVCSLEPKPPTTKSSLKIIVCIVISCLCCVVIGLVSYVVKLSLENRRYRRARRAERERFFGAAEQFANARRQNEESAQILRDLAAAANIPLPTATERPLNELEQLANAPPSDDASPSELPSLSTTQPTTEPQGPSTSSRARRIIQSGRQNIQSISRPITDRVRTRAQLLRQTLSRRVQFTRLRES